MSLVLVLLIKLIPVYLLILLGFIAGKVLQVKKESIATLLIYTIAPVVVFNGVVTTPLTLSTLSLPLLFFCIGGIICGLFYWLGGFFWKTSERNILAFAAASGNTGYFGIPVALALFGESHLGFVVLSTLGLILFENSVGFFIVAKGNHTSREALIKLVTLPSLYAFILGVIVYSSHISLGSVLNDVMTSFRGAYTILGMMLLGLGMASVSRAHLDRPFTVLAFIAKFIVWPVVVGCIIFLDSTFWHFYTTDIYTVILLLSIVPLAANTVAFATQLRAHPEKAALTVLLSTLFAILYIPLFIAFVFPFLQ